MLGGVTAPPNERCVRSVGFAAGLVAIGEGTLAVGAAAGADVAAGAALV